MEAPVLVVDNGACKCRMGMAGSSQPHVVFQNAVAKTKSDTKLTFGSGIERLRSINQLVVRRPLDRGYLINWQLETAIWARMLEQHLPQVNTSEAGLLMTEPLLNLPSIRHATLQIAFEQFGFRSFHAAPAPVFSLYKWAADHPEDAAVQGLSGIVLDAGYSFTHAVPIFDGRVQTPAVRRLRLGGKLLTNLMKEWVSYRSMNLKDETYLVEHIKEQVCYVAPDATSEMVKCFPKNKSSIALEVLLPDGVQNIKGIVQDPREPSVMEAKARHAAAGHAQPATLHVNNERFMTPEALFCPSDIGVDQAGVCETISNCVNACHPVFRPLLAQNVLVCGGTSCCPGFKRRVERDLRPLLDTDYDVAVNQGADPANMAWQGASLFAASPEYARVAVTRAQYQEQGAHRLADVMTML